MKLIGTVGNDWTVKHGVRGGLNDAALREWRDYFEAQLADALDIDSDITIGRETRFTFSGKNDAHTITEIESFARKCLDRFLQKVGK